MASQALIPFTVHDMHALKRVSLSDAALTASNYPLGIFSSSEWNESTNKKRSSIYSVNLTSSDVKQITGSDWGISDVSPKLLSCGQKVLFLSNRLGGELRPFTANLDGSNIAPLLGFSLPDNIEMDNLVLSPDGTYFLFTTNVFADCKDIQCSSDRFKQQDAQDHKVFDELYVRHWGTWNDHSNQHIFIQRLTQNGQVWSANGSPKDLMFGLNVDSPVKPFGGTEQIAISSDSTWIVFTAEQQRHDTAWRTDWDTYLVNVNDSNPICITNSRKARTQNPVFSPDGNYLFFGGMEIPGAESDRVRIVSREISSGKESYVAGDWDRSVDAIYFATQDNIIVEASDDGIAKLFSISLNNGEIKEIVSTGANHGLLRIRDRKGGVYGNDFVYARSSMTYPSDIFSFTYTPGSSANPKQLTFFNKDLLSQVELVVPEKIHFPCEDPQPDTQGKGCQAWIMKPVNFQQGRKYPVAHIVHGGPEGAFDDSWSYRWNPQLWTSRGYAVIMVNPHGSTSFGQKFTEAVLNNWGGTPYRTLQKGLDYFLQNYDWTDSSRLGYAGASYGGFMAAWTACHTNRYKAIVMHDGVFDSVSQGYETDELFFGEREFGGTVYDNFEGYDKYNPRKLINQIDKKQNILVVQGGYDFRIIEGQGISMFTALRRQGINSRLLYFPHENHWVLQQRNSIVWYDQVLGWFDKYI